MTITFEEVLEILRKYEYEQECNMDGCTEVNSYAFISAAKKHQAANEIRHLFYDLVEEKLNEK